SLEMARRGIRPAALDLSGEMVAYGSRLARDAGVEIEYIQADMADFQLSAPVDLAFLPLDSISYLLDNETVYRHLDSVAEALTYNGVYVLEISHPRDMFGVRKATKTDWEMERGGKKVHLVWGTEDDSFDPVSQLTDVSVSVSVSEAGKTTEYISRAKQRSFSCTEIQALVRASGRFELIRMYGAMDAEIDLSHPKAWRMITALQKRP
ncbi:MAG: class I SAM-dependent methyltransferase, partial [Candidatus Zixiibacteriota bacterium]